MWKINASASELHWFIYIFLLFVSRFNEFILSLNYYVIDLWIKSLFKNEIYLLKQQFKVLQMWNESKYMLYNYK